MSSMATVRHHVVMRVSADAAWELLGDPARLAEWFPGITECVVEGSTRTVTLQSGFSLPEEIITVDQLQRRFQYSLRLPVIRSHLSTLDVLELDDTSCCCVYGCDAVPAVMALVIAGAAAEGLERARTTLEEA
jgi:hypothetical protein